MSWRHHVEAVFCAVLLLASVFLLALQSILPIATRRQSASEGLIDQTSASTQAPHFSTMSKSKNLIAPQRARAPQDGLDPLSDLGSLWDEGPTYDLSRDDTDY
jgi:hypothetical protein